LAPAFTGSVGEELDLRAAAALEVNQVVVVQARRRHVGDARDIGGAFLGDELGDEGVGGAHAEAEAVVAVDREVPGAGGRDEEKAAGVDGVVVLVAGAEAVARHGADVAVAAEVRLRRGVGGGVGIVDDADAVVGRRERHRRVIGRQREQGLRLVDVVDGAEGADVGLADFDDVAGVDADEARRLCHHGRGREAVFQALQPRATPPEPALAPGSPARGISFRPPLPHVPQHDAPPLVLMMEITALAPAAGPWRASRERGRQSGRPTLPQGGVSAGFRRSGPRAFRKSGSHYTVKKTRPQSGESSKSAVFSCLAGITGTAVPIG
jgi:hypothetical protein